jgi:hypothetical protein
MPLVADATGGKKKKTMRNSIMRRERRQSEL